MKQIVLKNNKNELIRFFNCDTNSVYLVYRKHKKRLDFCSSPHFFSKEPVLLVDEFQVDELKSRPVPGMDAVIECYSGSEELIEMNSDSNSLFEDDFFHKVLSGAVVLFALFVFMISNFEWNEQSPERKLAKQHTVEIKKTPTATQVKKIQINNQRKLSSVVKEKTKNPVVKKSLKKRGVLAALGELTQSESKQEAGLNLTGAKATKGPGFQALNSNVEGSGGVQSQVYSKGMISAALGSGGNIRGGGGHGTKGTKKGGGSAGYGVLSLVGSGGEKDLSQSNDFSLEGEALDLSIIDREFLKKYHLFRACYLQATQKESDLKGLFQFYFQVNRKGSVTSSRLNPSSPVKSPVISSCLFKNINQIKFPIQLETSIELAYAFDLSELEN